MSTDERIASSCGESLKEGKGKIGDLRMNDFHALRNTLAYYIAFSIFDHLEDRLLMQVFNQLGQLWPQDRHIFVLVRSSNKNDLTS